MRRRPPTLFRVSRILRLVGLAVLTAILVYTGLAIYSASEVRPDVHGGGTSAGLEANGTAQVSQTINLTNPGYFAFTDLSTAVLLTWPNGTVVGHGGSAATTIPAGGESRINVSFWLPMATTASRLLTTSATLPLIVWLNLTYASLVTLHVSAQQNYSWGAPFSQFNATPGTPTPQSNGTVLVPVRVTYANDADFAVGGIATVTVADSSGAACGSSTLPMGSSPHSSYDQTLDLFLPASCNPSGGSVTVTYTGSGITYTFPREAIP